MNSKTKEHVIVGAIVTFVFVPQSGLPLIGGALAGYLEGPDLRSGATVGVLAGLVALTAVMVVSVGVAFLRELHFGLLHVLWEGLPNAAVEGFVPMVVLPLIGGGIGAYVRRETQE